MINIERAMSSNRITKSLTGLNIEKFKEIVQNGAYLEQKS